MPESTTTHITVELDTEDLETTSRELLKVLESPEVSDWTIKPEDGQ